MQKAGYKTVCLGKWHMGQGPGRHPMAQGYEHFSGFLGGSRSYGPLARTSKAQSLQRDGVAVDESEVGYLTDWITEEACTRIRERDRKRPLMMVVNYNAPHTPMHALPEDLERFSGIQDNPEETKDVLTSHPAVFARLKADLSDWESQMQAPLWREGKRWERNQRFKHRMNTLGRAAERKFP